MQLSFLDNGKQTVLDAAPDFQASYDIVVGGFGSAGIISGIIGAEAGLSVAAVDKLNMAGGTSTGGGITNYYFGLPGGFFEELDREAEKLYEPHFARHNRLHGDLKAYVAERRFLAAGGKLYYESGIIGVWKKGTRIAGLRLSTPDGRKDIACRILIDGSGDGQVSAMAGAGFRFGRESDGHAQPYTGMALCRQDDKLCGTNFDAGYADATDSSDMTRAIIAANALHAPDENIPVREFFWLTRLPGLREGRLIDCEDMLTFAGCLGKRTDKWRVLAYDYANFDSHSNDWALEDENARNWMVVASLWGKNIVVPLTLGNLTVKGFDNLMVVGRALGADHLAASLMRMLRGMQKTGEIAARAAILSCRGNIPLREVDQNILARELRDSRCLDPTILPKWEFASDISVLRELFHSDAPGEAIWQCGNQLPRYRPLLLELLNGSDRHAAANAALALGLGRDPAALPVLRGILDSDDDFLPRTSRKQNHRRILAAADLLGRLGNEQDITRLLAKLPTCTGDAQLLSHLIRALLESGTRHPACRENIRSFLETVLASDSYDYNIILKKDAHVKLSMFTDVRASLTKMAGQVFQNWQGDQKS